MVTDMGIMSIYALPSAFLSWREHGAQGMAMFAFGQAEMQHQEALQLRKELVGKDHPSMAECLNNLGGS